MGKTMGQFSAKRNNPDNEKFEGKESDTPNYPDKGKKAFRKGKSMGSYAAKKMGGCA